MRAKSPKVIDLGDVYHDLLRSPFGVETCPRLSAAAEARLFGQKINGKRSLPPFAAL
ncbi:hypothetical protein [Azorhizobium oxalatiphilum]|uniref:hypothetical protein n=1 Tax=Azorhizobium oxalatiphilum TaxID=980631 RepID=UPI00166E7768|nr:hypothetical protein [Azorhizobium oxalatiphilum]